MKTKNQKTHQKTLAPFLFFLFSVGKDVDGKVDLGGHRLQTLDDQALEQSAGLLVTQVQVHGVPDVLDVLLGLQLGNARRQHHGKEVHKDVGVATEGVVAFAAKVDETLEGFTSTRPHHVGKLGRQHKRRPLPLDPCKLLVVAQEMTKVDI